MFNFQNARKMCLSLNLSFTLKIADQSVSKLAQKMYIKLTDVILYEISRLVEETFSSTFLHGEKSKKNLSLKKKKDEIASQTYNIIS